MTHYDQAKFLAWVCAILGFAGIAFVFGDEQRFLLPGSLLLGAATVAFAVLARPNDRR